MKQKTLSILIILAVVIIAAVMRILPHPSNFAPVAAMALFGGVYLDKKYALLVPLLVMAVSDFFIGIHESIPFVYLSFLLTGLMGMWLKKHKTATNVLAATLFSSVMFFLITNFGYWLSNSLYPKTFEGQLQAYYFALPFFRNTMLGDFVYVTLFFGGYELIFRIVTSRKISQTKV